MPRLDGARMHGADGNLMHAVALDAHELVGIHD
jgi:hypothetical protein